MRVVLVVPNFRWIESDESWLWNYIPYNLCLLAATIRDISWDRINFTDAKKLKRTAEKMSITEQELNDIRKKTIENITI